MLKIDCLLKNTEAAETVRDIIGYLGHKWIAEGKDASFESIYRYLQKNEVEVDKISAAKIYADVLDLNDSRYTSVKELQVASGAWREKIMRAMMLQESNKKTLMIGDLPPSKSIAKSIADSFTSDLVKDESIKTQLKQLEDVARKAAMRFLGEKPEVDRSDKRTTEKIISDALENEKLGYRDKDTGVLLGLPRLWDEIRKEIKSISKDVKSDAERDIVESWEDYVNGLEEASYTLALSTKEAQAVLHDALMDSGFVKTTKKGNRIVDWKALASNQNSVSQLRENVISALTKKGIDANVANRVADTLHKEFKEVRANMLEINDVRREQINQTWQDVEKAVKETLPELVSRRIKEWQNYTKFEGRENEPLVFRQIEAKKIIGDALKKSDDYGMDWGVDKRAIDWVALAGRRPEIDSMKDLVAERLVADGISEADAAMAAESVVEMYHDQFQKDIDDNSKKILDTKQASLERYRANRKSELERLAELHDLGIFENAHNTLLAKVLGLQESDIEAMDAIRGYAEQMSRLQHIMAGQEFIGATRQREIAREIQKIISQSVNEKTGALKVMSAFNKVFQLENVRLITNWVNLTENHLSGALKYAITNLSVRMRLGNDAVGRQKELFKSMHDTWAYINEGGVETGLAPQMVGSTQERLMDKYNLREMKGKSIKDFKTWKDAAMTGVLSLARMGLSAADGGFKVGNYRLFFIESMYDTMMATGNYSKEEAISIISDAMQSPGRLEAAKRRAEEIYKDTGVQNPSRKQVNVMANELLIEALIGHPGIDADVLKQVHESSFKMAGLAMGHESNNMFSTMIQSSKIRMQQKEMEAFNKGRNGAAAGWSFLNTLTNSVVLRFAQSQANWAWIKMEQSGGGVFTSLYHYAAAKKIKNSELLESGKMPEFVEEYQKARHAMANALFGLSFNALAAGATIGAANVFFGDEENPVDELFDYIGDNYPLKRFFVKTSPLWMSSWYLANQDKRNNPIAAMNTVIENMTGGIGSGKNVVTKTTDAFTKAASKNKSTSRKGIAEIGSVVGSMIPSTPIYTQARDVLQTIDWARTGEPPTRNYPKNFLQGMLGGAVIQDVSSLLPEESRPEWMDYWWGKK